MFTHSHSSTNKFETCPRMFEDRYLLKHYEPKTVHTDWGERVHTAMEDKAKGALEVLPEGMEKMEWAVAPAKAAHDAGLLVLTEHKIALDRQMRSVTFESKLAWIRAIVDTAILGKTAALISDYKTGTKRESWQLEMSSLIFFYTYPKLEVIESRYLWLKETNPALRVTRKDYRRRDTPTMAGDILPRLMKVEKALETGVFPPKPGGLCKKHCNVTACQYNGRQ